MSVNMCGTLEHIKCLTETFGATQSHCVVSLILMELGVATQHDGYDYLIKSVMVYHESPTPMTMKELYPAVAHMYSRTVTEAQLEHSMRSAIKAAWKKRDESVWIRYFSPGSNGKIEKPSNTEFISRVARVLELWEGCCKGCKSKTCKEDEV